jgi:hypothetical protein
MQHNSGCNWRVDFISRPEGLRTARYASVALVVRGKRFRFVAGTVAEASCRLKVLCITVPTISDADRQDVFIERCRPPANDYFTTLT